MKTRAKRLLTKLGLLVAAGLAYALFTALTGVGLPCPFHAVTGLWCPGCGVSRMCLALLKLDFAAAWSWNPGLMLLLPFLAALGLRLAARYIRTGRARPARGERVVMGLMVAFLVVYGVARNLSGFTWLAPGQTPPELFPLLRTLTGTG